MIRLLVTLAFFVSGASSLMLEVVWSKSLGHVVGNTLEAITTVVAAYLGGLALGAMLAGRTHVGRRNPVRAYGLLETGVGLFGLASPWLIRAIAGPIGAAYEHLGGASPAYYVARFLATFLLLLVPTILMGATLPILVSWGSRRADLARVLGTLYAVNTAGAVLGTALAGFVLLPAWGLSRTAALAGSISLGLGLVMAWAGRKGDVDADAPARPVAAPAAANAAAGDVATAAPAAPDFRPRLMAGLFALGGMVSLTAQIAWSRVAGVLLGSSVYSFSLVLATFLAGLALGAAAIVPWLARRGASWRLFAVLAWVAAIGILFASVRIADAPWDILDRIVTAQGAVGRLWWSECLLLAGFMLPACLAFGALFPVATRLAALPGEPPETTTGRAYAWNTLGTIAGSLLTGFVLVHTLGVRGTLLGAAGLSLASGIVAWLVAPRPVRRRSSIPEGAPVAVIAGPALAIGVFVVVLTFSPPWNRGLMAIGIFRPLVATMSMSSLTPDAAREAVRSELAQEEVLLSVEGRQGTVTAVRTRTVPPITAIRFNGKTDASTGPDMATQVLLGELPMMWAPDSARVAVVGYGSGVTAGSALTHPLRSLDLLEIEPAVMAADPLFRPWNGNPTADPRFRLHLEDGRTFLAHAREPYDVIVSEPSNPWLAGVNNLFTVDFDRLVKNHLSRSGVFCQWVQYYELSGPTLSSILRSIDSVFPHAHVFLVGRDLLVVATASGQPLDLARVAQRLARPAVAQDLARAGVRTPADLVALRQCALADLVATLPAAPLNLDDRPYVEYRAPRDLYTVLPSESPLAETALHGADPVKDLAAWTTGQPPLDLAIAVTSSLMAAGRLSQATRWLGALTSRDSLRAGPLFAALQQATEDYNRRAVLQQARQALAQNQDADARRVLDNLLRDRPRWAPALVERGRVSMRADSLAPARALLESGAALGDDDDRYEAYLNLGVLCMREGKTTEGLADFARCNALKPAEAEAWILRARALAMTGQPAAARVVLEQARAAAADSTAIVTAQNQLQATGTLQ